MNNEELIEAFGTNFIGWYLYCSEESNIPKENWYNVWRLNNIRRFLHENGCKPSMENWRILNHGKEASTDKPGVMMASWKFSKKVLKGHFFPTNNSMLTIGELVEMAGKLPSDYMANDDVGFSSNVEWFMIFDHKINKAVAVAEESSVWNIMDSKCVRKAMYQCTEFEDNFNGTYSALFRKRYEMIKLKSIDEIIHYSKFKEL